MQHSCRPFTGFNHVARILILLVWILTGWKSGSIPFATAAAAAPAAPKVQWSDLDLQGPPGSGQFGMSVYPLLNGNLVVVDPYYSDGSVSQIGAVYLYDTGHTLLHRLTGSQANDQVGYYGVKVLANGSYLVLSPNWDRGGIADAGAVTWCSGDTGCDGVISAGNSLVGSTAGDKLGSSIKVLLTGNYLVINYSWANGAVTQAGAVTWCSAKTGCFGEVSPANSLVGSHNLDRVGLFVTELGDGDYVVSSVYWRNDANLSVGAVTWCSGTAGCTGTVSGSNSLVGSQLGDNIGWSVSALADDDFVVISPDWANGAVKSAGAVTWCSGTTGCAGVVSSSNSLVGSQASDRVGSKKIAPLGNGNYVVISLQWANGSLATAGAVTWCRGDGSCVGTVLANHSLVGSRSGDQVGHDGVQGLTNGNYVAISTLSRNGINTRATFCSGTNGCNGMIDTETSLGYVNPASNLASMPMSVTPLDDGNYVVSTPSWWNGSTAHAGAATWCSGQTGCTGSVTASNSLTGSHAEDLVGQEVYPLPGGRYVVDSDGWANGVNQFAGAVTFCNGSPGCTGVVSAQNSLVGEHNSDSIGLNLIVVANGNYVVSSGSWDNGTATNVGQVTWCSGRTGCTGTVLSNHSLIGGQAGSFVGDDPLVALSNGNYVAKSYSWKNGAVSGAGAATWCPGDTGCAGILSDQNSLAGTQTNDHVSNIINPLSSGNYLMIHNTWSNGSTASSGAVTFGAGNAPVPVGPVSAENSLLGTMANGGNSLTTAFDAMNGLLVVGKPKENRVSFLNIPSTAIASGAWDDPKTWDFGVPAPNGEAIISAEHHVTVSGITSVRKVTIQTGGMLVLAAGSSLAVHGQFDNQGDFEGLAGTVIVAGPGEVGLNADNPTNFGNLTIESGAVLVEQPLAEFFFITGRLDNQGVIRKAQPVGGTGRMSFGLTGVTVDVTGIGGLQQIQMDRIDQNHPHAGDGDGRYRLVSGTYFSLSTTPMDGQAYQVGLYLPIAETNERTAVCWYNGAGWDCTRSGTEGRAVWLDGISQLAGDWSVGQEKNPAAIQLNSLNQVYDGAPKAVQAVTTPAGLNVSVVYTGTNGTLYGSTAIPPVNAGSYNIQATIEDAIYMGYASETLTIAKADQTISFGALADKTYEDADFSVSASAGSGLTVRFRVESQNACTVTGSTIHLSGTGSCTVTAEQPGDENHNPAKPISHSFMINKANAILHLSSPIFTYNGSPILIEMETIPAGLSVSVVYTSINGTAYGPTANPPVNTGSYSAQATINNVNYTGSASMTFSIARAGQTITYSLLADKTYGDPDFSVNATTSSGLPVRYTVGNQDACTIIGSTVHLTGAGRCTVTAEQAGNQNYNPADPVLRTFIISKASASVSLTGLNQSYDGTPKPVQAVTVPAGLSVNIVYTGINGVSYGPTGTPPVDVGSYSAQATINDANYTGNAAATLTIAKANQAIDFGTLVDKIYWDADFTVSASASSGLPVEFTVGSQDACTISGSTIHLTGAGSCTVTAGQAGNQNYNAAQPVSRSFTIAKASAAIVLDNLNQLYDGNPKPVSVHTSPTGLTLFITYQGETYGPTSEPPSLPGSYTVYVEIEDANYRGAVSGTLVVVRFSLFLPIIKK